MSKGCMFLYNLIFNLSNFVLNVGQNARFSLLTYLRLTQFSCTVIGSVPDDFMPLKKIHIFLTWREATFQMIYVFEQDTIFFPGGFFCIYLYPV